MDGPLAWIVWTFVTGCLGTACWRSASRLLPEEGVAETLSAAILAAWSIPVVVARACSLTGYLTGTALLAFPSDWDSLNYHLPLIDQWLQARSLYAPACMHWFNPGNATILGLWLAAPFPNDSLVALLNLSCVVLLASATLTLGSALELPYLWRHLIAFAVVANTVVWNQLTSAENDVAAASLWVTALAHGLTWRRTRRIGNLLSAALAIGLLAGVKYYALGTAFLAALLVVRDVRSAFVVALALVLLGGPWYARNWVVAGSPLYPRGLTAETDDLARLYPAVAATSFVGNGRAELPWLALVAVYRMAGPVHLLAVLALPIVVPRLIFGPAMPGRRTLALAIIGSGVLLAITPFAVEDVPGTLNQLRWHYCPVRYGLCFLSVAVVGLAVVLADLGCRPLVWLLGLGAAIQFFAPDSRLTIRPMESFLIAVNLALLVAVVGLLGAIVPSRRLAGLGTVLLVAGVVLAGSERSRYWHAGYSRFYDDHHGTTLFTHLDREVGGVTVCVLDYRSYPFFGPDRRRRVCQPVFSRDEAAFLRYLTDHAVTHVAMPDPPRERGGWRTFATAEACVSKRDAVFVPAVEVPGWRLYRVEGDALVRVLATPE